MVCAAIDRTYLFFSSHLPCNENLSTEVFFFSNASLFEKLCRGTRLRWASPGCFLVGVIGAVLRTKKKRGRGAHKHTRQTQKNQKPTSNTHRRRRGINTDSRHSRAASGASERKDATRKDKGARRRKLHTSNVLPSTPPTVTFISGNILPLCRHNESDSVPPLSSLPSNLNEFQEVAGNDRAAKKGLKLS